MNKKRCPPKSAWKPGESGNPAGRKPGTKNASTQLREMIDVEKIITQLQTSALAGDVPAARTLLERALPVYRSAAAPVEIPELADAADLTKKAHSVLDAVACGRVPPDVGANLVAAIGSVARLAEVDELLRRVTALEEASKGTKS
jgi:hypothetical protein